MVNGENGRRVDDAIWVCLSTVIVMDFFVEYACHQPKFSESHDKFGYEKAKWFGLCLECF